MVLMSAAEDIPNAFGSERPFSVGVEEELFLVDPVTGRQTNASAAVQERLGPVDGTVESELHACQVELITDVCSSAGEAAVTLGGLRRAVIATGAGLLGSGGPPPPRGGAAGGAGERGGSDRAPTPRRGRARRRSRTRSATSASAICWGTRWQRR